eukprot:417220-Prymnesium_polylepis.1
MVLAAWAGRTSTTPNPQPTRNHRQFTRPTGPDARAAPGEGTCRRALHPHSPAIHVEEFHLAPVEAVALVSDVRDRSELRLVVLNEEAPHVGGDQVRDAHPQPVVRVSLEVEAHAALAPVKAVVAACYVPCDRLHDRGLIEPDLDVRVGRA